MKIHPSLLAANLSNMEKEVTSVLSPHTKSVHFDIGDGIFVPSCMLDPVYIQTIPKEATIDVHLMVQYPSKYFSKFLQNKQIKAVAFHIESKEDIRENITHIRTHGREVGLAILASTPADHIDQYLLEIDYILVMTVKGGFSGTPFIPEVLKKIQEIHQKRPELTILVDGGITIDTAQLCVNHGATEAVVGSALFSQKKRKEYLRLLSEIVQK